MRRWLVVALAFALVACGEVSKPSPVPAIDATVGIILTELHTTGPARLILVGDTGTGEQPQKDVAAGMKTLQVANPVDAVILLGDNFYPDGPTSTSDPQWNTAFRDVYAPGDFPVPFYPVSGNHDYRTDGQVQYDYVDPDGRWTLDSPAEVLPIKADGVLVAEFFLIDSEQIVTGTDQGNAIVTWTKQRIASSSAPWKFLAMHHPPVSHGKHGNTAAIQSAFHDEFVAGTIPMVFAGHDHDLELVRTDTVDYVVSGAGAELRPLPDVGQAFAASTLGFVELEIGAATVTLRFRGADGAVLKTFTRNLTP